MRHQLEWVAAGISLYTVMSGDFLAHMRDSFRLMCRSRTNSDIAGSNDRVNQFIGYEP
jgi:hypothetical protein